MKKGFEFKAKGISNPLEKTARFPINDNDENIYSFSPLFAGLKSRNIGR